MQMQKSVCDAITKFRSQGKCSRSSNNRCPLWAKSGHRSDPTARLLDDLVGALPEEQRNIEAERLGSLGVDGHLKFGRQLDGKLRRLCATENAIDVGC